jgi:hypothetical protein
LTNNKCLKLNTVQIQVANDPMTKLQIRFIHTRGDLPSRLLRGKLKGEFHGFRSSKKDAKQKTVNSDGVGVQ